MAEEEKQANPPQDQEHQSTDSPAHLLPRFYGALGGGNSSEKDSWPELVGLMADEAEKKIKEEKPRAIVQVVGPDCFTTMDFNTGRVRLYVDPSGKVERRPRIG
ncbi:subtilisin inhibitor-like [Punica granatum]|uniref:Subtilisin inhibitor-like n=2 Tax=Punica granatum TaxID=22663 RepID=A0A6P8DSJ0_PUNGR|nr:subtilisin inhibitor-like [Punica granatum]PKI43452.1 hypothetical protein CRG98_036209 [Punica granatum]